MDFLAIKQLAVALGLGLLLGLERERHGSSIGGIRTLPLVALFGAICAQLAPAFGGWMVGAGFIAVAAMVVAANLSRAKAGEVDPGMTTEVAVLLLFALGAYAVAGSTTGAVVIGGVTALLLHGKTRLHHIAQAIGERDMRAIMQFVFLSLVILPVLPSAEYGPFGVWNPFKIWLMVVLIVGLSLSGYVALKVFGARGGSALAGLFGGLISSTATTLSYARRTAENPALAGLAAGVIMLAACVSLLRVLLEIAAVAPRSFPALAWPVATLLGACGTITAVIFAAARCRDCEVPDQRNPAELKSALVFGGLYAMVLLAVAAAKHFYGDAGIYMVAVLSGLTDMDAITLSSAGLVEAGKSEAGTGWRVIVVAALANFAFKLGTVAVIGHRRLLGWSGLAFAGAGAAGAAILWRWP